MKVEISKIPLIVILGPTSSGKSDLGIRLAKKWNGEIVSADSRQVYVGLDLGTGKVTKKEQKQIPHHLLDVVQPGKRMDIARYKKRAEFAIYDIWNRGKVPFLVGGSVLYANVIMYNYLLPGVGSTRLRKKLEQKSLSSLLALLQKRDSATYLKIDHANKRRIVRALEVCLATKKPFSEFQKRGEKKFDCLILGIDIPREELYKRIDARLDARIKQGMLREVKKLIEKKISKKWLKALGLEYRFLTEYFEGTQGSKEKKEMLQTLKYAIHDFARRQLVWLRKEKELHWIRNERQAENLCKRFLKQYVPTHIKNRDKKTKSKLP